MLTCRIVATVGVRIMYSCRVSASENMKRGFTLIELLVVIAMIAVLMALLLAGRAIRPRGGPPGPVHQQPEADRPGGLELRDPGREPSHRNPHEARSHVRAPLRRRPELPSSRCSANSSNSRFTTPRTSAAASTPESNSTVYAAGLSTLWCPSDGQIIGKRSSFGPYADQPQSDRRLHKLCGFYRDVATRNP